MIAEHARIRSGPSPHPLDPLSAEEIRSAAAILRRDRDVGERWRFASIELREPSKATVGSFAPGDPIRREAEVICWDRDSARTFKALVVLGEDAVAGWEERPGEQPNMTADEFHECDGTLVDERTYAPFHQHFLVARLDLDIDGERNTVYATESEALPLGPDNPHGLALVQRDTPLRTERQGKQDYDWRTQRAWKVVNEHVANRLGTPVGYKLVPGAAIPPMLDAGSPVLGRAEAIAHTLWVTPFDADERWPCGEFVVQSREDADHGLPGWTAADRPIEDTDVVLWYVFGIHHITRPEEWPVMSVDTVSFWLKPVGFFDRNPALDVAPALPQCHHEESG